MRILGIDPGTTAMGFGVIDAGTPGVRVVASGVIRVGGPVLADRLTEIQARLTAVIAEHAPEAAALEAVFTARNPRSALVLGHARGVALAVCGAAGLATAEYAPAQIKAAVTGSGCAGKPQVQAMVQRLCGLAKPPATDEADALAAAICHAAGARSPLALRRQRSRPRRLRDLRP